MESHSIEDYVIQWISSILVERQAELKVGHLPTVLKDGTLLCELLNILRPDSVCVIDPSKSRENITSYLQACKKLGFTMDQLFLPDDLLDGNMKKVVSHLDILRNFSSNADMPAPEPSWKDKAPTKKSTAVVLSSNNNEEQQIKEAFQYSPILSDTDRLRYNPQLELLAWNWLEEVLGEKVGEGSSGKLISHLKTGVLLCQVINKIQPGLIQKIHTKPLSFLYIENIGEFLAALPKLGLNSTMFSVLDLADERRPSRVIVGILALANHVSKHLEGYKGPIIKENVNLTAKSMYSQAFIDGEDVAEAALTPAQQRVVDWANSQFESRGSPIRISSLLSDLRSGLKLLELIQILSSVPYANYLHYQSPSSLVECTTNVTLAFRILYMYNFNTVACCTPTEVVQGDVQAILALLEYLRSTFDLSAMYRELLGSPCTQLAFLTLPDIDDEEADEDEEWLNDEKEEDGGFEGLIEDNASTDKAQLAEPEPQPEPTSEQKVETTPETQEAITDKTEDEQPRSITVELETPKETPVEDNTTKKKPKRERSKSEQVKTKLIDKSSTEAVPATITIESMKSDDKKKSSKGKDSKDKSKKSSKDKKEDKKEDKLEPEVKKDKKVRLMKDSRDSKDSRGSGDSREQDDCYSPANSKESLKRSKSRPRTGKDTFLEAEPSQRSSESTPRRNASRSDMTRGLARTRSKRDADTLKKSAEKALSLIKPDREPAEEPAQAESEQTPVRRVRQLQRRHTDQTHSRKISTSSDEKKPAIKPKLADHVSKGKSSSSDNPKTEKSRSKSPTSRKGLIQRNTVRIRDNEPNSDIRTSPKTTDKTDRIEKTEKTEKTCKTNKADKTSTDIKSETKTDTLAITPEESTSQKETDTGNKENNRNSGNRKRNPTDRTISSSGLKLIPPRMDADSKMRRLLWSGLVETETKYVSTLELLHELASKLQQKCPTSALTKLCTHVQPIVEAHKKLLEKFEEVSVTLGDSPYSVILGQSFLLLEFQPYLGYLRCFADTFEDSADIKTLPDYKSFSSIVSDFEENHLQKLDTHLTLDTVLSLPVTGLSRYHSSVRRLLQYTPKEHPDNDKLFEAFSLITKRLESLDQELSTSGSTTAEMTAKLMSQRQSPVLSLKLSDDHHSSALRPRAGSTGAGMQATSSSSNSDRRSVTFREDEGARKSRAIRLSVIGLTPLQPELFQAQIEEERIRDEQQQQRQPKVRTPRRDTSVRKRNQKSGQVTAPQGHLSQRQKRGQVTELQQLLMEEDGTCMLPPSAFSFSSIGPIVKDWGPTMVFKKEYENPKDCGYKMTIIPDYYEDLFFKEKHYNFVGTKRTEKKFLIISVLKTPTDSKFTALRNTDNGFDLFEIPKAQVLKHHTTGRPISVALIKLLQQKYSETFFCQLREDANADVLAIEKKYRQELVTMRIGLVYGKPGQTNPFDMFTNKLTEVSDDFKHVTKLLKVPPTWEEDNKVLVPWKYEKNILWHQSMFMVLDTVRRIIGNTSVLLFFLDPHDEPFDASQLSNLGNVSQCFIIIKAEANHTYRVAVIHRVELNQPFGPYIPRDYLFTDKTLPDFLFTLVHNAYMALRYCKPTNVMYKIPRQAAINDVAEKHASPHWLEKLFT